MGFRLRPSMFRRAWMRRRRLPKHVVAALLCLSTVFLLRTRRSSWLQHQRRTDDGWDTFSIWLSADRSENEPGDQPVQTESAEYSLRQCFSEHRARTGHVPRIAFVGDSRSRFIYTAIGKVLNVKTDFVVRKAHWSERDQNSGPWSLLPGKHPLSWQKQRRYHYCFELTCSQNTSNEYVVLDQIWRPYLDEFFQGSVDELVASCRTDDKDQCPEIVTLQSGLWYSHRMPDMENVTQDTTILMMRFGLDMISGSVARLADLTNTVWKLEESVFNEFVWDEHMGGSKSEIKALMMLTNALVYDLALKVPNLHVWSSLLPETIQHVVDFCADTGGNKTEQCPDGVHMGARIERWLAMQLLNKVCTNLNERWKTGD